MASLLSVDLCVTTGAAGHALMANYFPLAGVILRCIGNLSKQWSGLSLSRSAALTHCEAVIALRRRWDWRADGSQSAELHVCSCV